jgi:hypothetical protein
MSDKVFVNDTVLLTLATGKVLSGFTDCKIKFEKPNGVRGLWASAIHPSNSQAIRSSVSFDLAGVWKVQAFVSKVGEKYHGMKVDIRVFEPLGPDTTVPPTTVPPTT